MKATKHPCDGLTKAQREAFESIAVGQCLGFHFTTYQKLLAKRLIERLPDKVVGKDIFGPIRLPDYQVPLPVHIQWCQWCDENVTDEMMDEKGQ